MTEHAIPSREAAWETLCEFTQNEQLRKHGLVVEVCMRALARHYGEDEEKWAAVGVMHDFDYEKFPTIPEHATEGAKILAERGWPDEMVKAILGHASYTGTPRDTLMAKALYAIDELSGFMIGVALVRPDKSFKTMEVKSVKKKLKDKAFCRAVNRDEVKDGAAELGWELDDLIRFLIDEMGKVEESLGLGSAYV
ncbi:MAG: HDIG domain-containing metalloprotein [bacterium]